MGGEWKHARLGDYVKIVHGWPFKSEHFTEKRTGRPVVVSIGNFKYTGGFRFESTTVKEYTADYPKEYELSPGDVLLVMTCQTAGGEILGVPARVPDDGITYLHNQRMGKAVIKDREALDPGFFYYLALTPEFNRELCVSASGTKILHTAPSRIEAFRFDLPPLAEQKRIAHMLGALDNRIELNRRMNTTLDAMARALFQSWFVDFDPVRSKLDGRTPDSLVEATSALFPAEFDETMAGEIPQGWRIGSVYEIADVIYGAPFASSMFNLEKVGTPLIRIRDLTNECTTTFTSELHPKGYLLRPGDIAVGMDGEFRAHLWGGAESWLNQRICVFVPKPGYSAAFVRNSIISPLAQVEATEIATTVIHLGKHDVDRFAVIIPNAPLVDVFNRQCQPWYDHIVSNKQQSFTLANLRDAMLPALLNGRTSFATIATPREADG